MALTVIDVETIPITPSNLAPRVICCSFAEGEDSWVLGNHPSDGLESTLRDLLQPPVRHIAGHNVAYDLMCIANTWPNLRPLIWRAYEERRVHDTLIREKLLHLSTHGNLDSLAGKQIRYSLAGIAEDRLGEDLSEDKQGSVRVRYGEMDGLRASDYPEEFLEYSRQDADITMRIFQSQRNATRSFLSTFKSEWLHVNMAWCLYHSTVRGLKVDKAYTLSLWDKTRAEIDLDNYPLLKSSGIITPASPPREYKRSPGKFTKGTKEKVNVKGALIPHVERVCRENKIDVEKTETGRTSTSKQVLSNLAPLDATLKEYQGRQALSKLVTTYFPAMEFPRQSGFLADSIHPQYDPLKKTGRISSRGNSARNKAPLYASVNVQQVDPRVRGCYVPREGYLYLSADYSALELCCLADDVYKTYKRSNLRDQLNSGIDPHAYLGAVLAGRSYEEFLRLKTTQPDYYKYWRTLAKPVGLGYPGGMGVKTMVKTCAGYGINIDQDRAWELRDLWLETYPVMREYLAFDGDENREYCSALGMIRAGCNYTQYCNGRGLQTPGAEGMKLATFRICKEAYDGGFLTGCHFIASIHDEVLMEVPDNEHAHIHAEMVRVIMVEEMKKILTTMNDRAVKVEPALMTRWDKRAEPVYNEAGELTVWEM